VGKAPTISDLLFDNSLKLKNGSALATRSETMIFTLDVRSLPLSIFLPNAYSKVAFEVAWNVVSHWTDGTAVGYAKKTHALSSV